MPILIFCLRDFSWRLVSETLSSCIFFYFFNILNRLNEEIETRRHQKKKSKDKAKQKQDEKAKEELKKRMQAAKEIAQLKKEKEEQAKLIQRLSKTQTPTPTPTPTPKPTPPPTPPRNGEPSVPPTPSTPMRSAANTPSTPMRSANPPTDGIDNRSKDDLIVQIKSLQNELNSKNLEIVNLKKQIVDLLQQLSQYKKDEPANKV